MIAKSVSIRKRKGKQKIKFPIPEKTPEKKKKKSNSKKWIIFILIAISLGLIWYFNQDNHQTKISNPPAKVEAQNSKEEPVIIEPSSERTRILDVGSYNFEMEADEETGWIQMPNKAVRYRIGSPDDRWIIIFDNGETVKGWDSEPIPARNLAKFKIKSLQKQCIKITIIEN